MGLGATAWRRGGAGELLTDGVLRRVWAPRSSSFDLGWLGSFDETGGRRGVVSDWVLVVGLGAFSGRATVRYLSSSVVPVVPALPPVAEPGAAMDRAGSSGRTSDGLSAPSVERFCVPNAGRPSD